MFGAARLYGLHRQGEEPMVVRDCRRPTTFWALKDPDFQPFEITDRSPE